MCGITGMLALHGQRPDEAILARMVDVIHHRGPDDSGTIIDGPCGLGNTRLAVIDLTEAGHQPMHVRHPGVSDTSLSDAWIAYNGEMYNFGEVRTTLEAIGQTFFSHSDTETLLRAYCQYGSPNFLKPFRGMFAFAIWDVSRKRLLLARDRLGEKPLYYTLTNDWFVFGSEIKTLLQHPAVTPRLHEAVIAHYLAYGYAPAPNTLFEGIHQLAPGNLMSIDVSGSGAPSLSIEPYWEPPYPGVESEIPDETTLAEELLKQLRTAVRMRMISDVPLGSFLSGGLDSAAVVALMAQESPRAVKTFAIGFANESSFDETFYARQIADQFHTDHHEFIVEPDVINLVDELVWHHDQPFGDSSAIPTYLVSKLARDHVTVALTGDGGDELFAGYDRFRAARLSQALENVPPLAIRAASLALEQLPESTSYRDTIRRANRFVKGAALPLAERYLSWVRYTPSGWMRKLMADTNEDSVVEHYTSLFAKSASQTNQKDIVAHLLQLNLTTYLPEDLLVKVDRTSMAVSLEARAPFLDHVLLQFVAGIPTSLKLKGSTSKYIFKKAMRGILPDEIIDRKKHGFGVPVGAWMRNGLADFVTATLSGPRAEARGIFHADAVKEMIAIHKSGGADLGQALWTLLTFELWMQRYFD